MNLIIFTGPPASGKSMLAQRCAEILQLPYYSKDSYKVELFEAHGFRCHAEKKQLSRRSEQMLLEAAQACCAADSDAVIDNNFKDFRAIRELQMTAGPRCNVVCIYLYAEPALLAHRYNMRIASGQREVPLYVLNVYPVVDGITEFHQPLTPDDVRRIDAAVTEPMYGDYAIRIDTSAIETNAEGIFRKVLCAVLNGMEGR